MFVILPIFLYIFNIYFQFDVFYKQYVKSLNKITTVKYNLPFK